MRIAPNDHPIARIRNTLLTASALLGLWALLSPTSCATPDPGYAPASPKAHSSQPTIQPTRRTMTLFSPSKPIPLAQKLAPLHALDLRT